MGNVVKPMLKMATDYMPHLISFTHVETQFRNHAYKLLNEGDLIDEYNVIMAIGGDGIVHEIVNGILERPDCESVVRRVHLCAIPAGLNNSLASMINDNRYPFPVKLNAKKMSLKYEQLCSSIVSRMIKRSTNKMDVLECHQNGKRTFSVTTTMVGLLSDIVTFSQKHKKSLDNRRGHFLATLKSIKDRKYFAAKLHYLPESSNATELTLDDLVRNERVRSGEVVTLSGEFLLVATVNNNHIDRQIAIHKRETVENSLQSGNVELLWMRKDKSSAHSMSIMKALMSSNRKGYLDPKDSLKMSS